MADTKHLTVREIDRKLRDHLSKVTPDELVRGIKRVHARHSQSEQKQNGRHETTAFSNNESDRETHASHRS